ncbi:MAG: oligosaccharide flippase family protein, partial [Bacteroidota bacterium]
MNPLKRLAGETAWYGLSSIVGRLVNYLLLPFYTNASLGIFQPEDYGVVRELYAYVALLNILYTFGMETTYFRYASRYEEQRVFNQATSFVTLISLLFSLVTIAAATPLVNAMGYTGKEVYLYYLAAVIAIDAIVAIPFAQLRWAKQPRRFAFVKLTNIFLNIALNIFFLLICRDVAAGKYLTSLQPIAAWLYDPTLKVGYVFLANLIANALFFLLLRRSFLRYRPYWDTTLLKDMLRYAYPLIFMGLAGLINTMADVYFIKYYMPASLYPAVQQLVANEEGITVGQYMLGAYNACIKFAIFMMLVVQAYRYAAEPFFF